jgi:hypothetical protein
MKKQSAGLRSNKSNVFRNHFLNYLKIYDLNISKNQIHLEFQVIT